MKMEIARRRPSSANREREFRLQAACFHGAETVSKTNWPTEVVGKQRSWSSVREPPRLPVHS